MRLSGLSIVFLGLSITSSWGNGHATTYRGLMRELAARSHRVLFLERDVPWYAANRDLPQPPWGRTFLYRDLEDLHARFTAEIRTADLVIVGSYLPDGVPVAWWVLENAPGVTAFYDIDTPVTMAKLQAGDFQYLTPDLIPGFELYLSFTGGPLLRRLEKEMGARRARVFYCSADPGFYFPEAVAPAWDLGYLGTYSPDRQQALDRLLLNPATAWAGGRFVVAGPQFPAGVHWPANVCRINHLPPPEHRRFYNSQRYTLNLTRADMQQAGWSPSVRLFEAAACGVPVISDWWPGLDTLFKPELEILIAVSGREILHYLRDLTEVERQAIGKRARERVLAEHTAGHRALQLEEYYTEVVSSSLNRPERRPDAAGGAEHPGQQVRRHLL